MSVNFVLFKVGCSYIRTNKLTFLFLVCTTAISTADVRAITISRKEHVHLPPTFDPWIENFISCWRTNASITWNSDLKREKVRQTAMFVNDDAQSWIVKRFSLAYVYILKSRTPHQVIIYFDAFRNYFSKVKVTHHLGEKVVFKVTYPDEKIS